MDGTPQLEGLPSGALVTPLGSAPQGQTPVLQGMPAGATVTPLAQPAGTQAGSQAGGDPALQMRAGDGMLMTGAKALNAVGAGAGAGLLETINSTASLLHIPHALTQQRQQQLEQENSENPILGGTGKALETIAEFVSGDTALMGLSHATKIGETARVLKLMEKYPRMAQALATGIRQGAVGSAQAVAHGASPGDAAETGALTGGIGGAAELAIPTAMSGFKAIMDKIRPGTTEIAGESIPILASQRPGGSKIGGATAANTPKIAAAQQEGTQNAVRNIAQRATQTALDRVNEARAPVPTDPARLLEAADNPEPFKFSSDGLSPDTANPVEAQTTLSRLNDFTENSSAFEQMSGDEQNRFKNARDSLAQQLDLYHSHQSASPNFAPVDSAAAAGQVSHFGEASDQVQLAAQPVYQKLDDLSDGNFTALREQRKTAMKVMRAPSTVDAYDRAAERLSDADDGIDKLFSEHKGAIRPEELQSANNAWRDAKVLDRVHTAVEGAITGPPADIAAKYGIPRTLRGNMLQTRLNQMLNKVPRAEIERVIGQDGLENLYRVGDLLGKPETSEPTRTAARAIALQLTSRVSRGALIGGAIGHFAGMPWEGAVAGAAAEDTARFVLRQAAINPRVGKMVDFAVRHQVNPRIFAPLVAAAIEHNQAEEPTDDNRQPEEAKQ